MHKQKHAYLYKKQSSNTQRHTHAHTQTHARTHAHTDIRGQSQARGRRAPGN